MGVVIIFNINGRMVSSIIYFCGYRYIGNFCFYQVIFQMDEFIAVAVFWCGFMGNIVIVIVIEMIVLNVEMDVVVFIIYIGLMAVGVCYNLVIVYCLCQYGGIQGDFCMISIFIVQILVFIIVLVEGVVKGIGLQFVFLDKGFFFCGGIVNGFYYLNIFIVGCQF